jgi:3-hydroxyisobutyrate dehydrogenase-like beta-hydroxyacid dehydrogenase
MTTNNNGQKISILGLGQMGRKLAALYAEAGFEVIVWNRTPRSVELHPSVRHAKSAAEAFEQSVISMICVSTNDAVVDVLNALHHSRSTGKILINFTTGSPGEVRGIESMLNEFGVGYLNGAIQVAPDQMGLPDTTILMAGSKLVFEETKDMLTILGGNIIFLSENASASPAMDMATLSWVQASYLGMIYGVALCEKEGIKLEDYSRIIADIAPNFVDFFKYEIKTIADNNFQVTQSPMSISVDSSRRIADSVKEMGINPDFTDVIAELLQKAKERGYGDEEVSALIKVVRGVHS